MWVSELSFANGLYPRVPGNTLKQPGAAWLRRERQGSRHEPEVRFQCLTPEPLSLHERGRDVLNQELSAVRREVESERLARHDLRHFGQGLSLFERPRGWIARTFPDELQIALLELPVAD